MEQKNTPITRGIRNNNPFNIKRSASRWLGKVPFSDSSDETFEQFDSIDHGLRAGMKLLCRYIQNYRLFTLRAIISRFCPDDVENYLDFFKSQYHFPADDEVFSYSHIDPLVFGSLCSGICWFESRYNLRYNDYFRILEYYHILNSFK